jgi:hypothetical protein
MSIGRDGSVRGRRELLHDVHAGGDVDIRGER